MKPILLLALLSSGLQAEIPQELRSSLLFHAGFDGSVEAAYAKGDGKIYNAPSYKELDKWKPGIGDVDAEIAPGEGLRGDALRFRKVNQQALFFRGKGNLGYRSADWSGSVSFWLRLDPEKDLKGFSDPIQLTDKAYNDSAIWVDFTKDERPRHFRLGVFGQLDAWNPKNLPPDKNPDFNNRLVVLEKPPFGADRWTHVAVTWSGINAGSPTATLYVDGKRAGSAAGIRESFQWDPDNATIRLGVNYAGLMDELAVFNRELSASEVEQVRDAARR